MALRTELKEQGDLLFKYRSYLPIVILLVAMYLYVVKEMRAGDAAGDARRMFELGCFAVCLLGLFIRVGAVGFTADRTSGRNTSEGQIANSINKTGLYSLCRHPLYLGNFFMWLGLAAFTHNAWFVVAFVFMYWVYYERIMFAEEEYLIGKFGEEYITFSKGSNAFVPALGKWVKPDTRFSLRKVVRQEKAGILNLFLVILLFRLLAAHFAHGTWQVERRWIYGLGLAVCWYVVIKVLQKTTNLLSADR